MRSVVRCVERVSGAVVRLMRRGCWDMRGRRYSVYFFFLLVCLDLYLNIFLVQRAVVEWRTW